MELEKNLMPMRARRYHIGSRPSTNMVRLDLSRCPPVWNPGRSQPGSRGRAAWCRRWLRPSLDERPNVVSLKKSKKDSNFAWKMIRFFFFVKPITISPKKRLYAQRFCFEIKKCTVWKFCVHFIPQHHSVEVLALFFYHSDFSWNQFWKRLEVTVWKIRVKCDHPEIFFVKSNCKNLWNWLLQIHYFLCLKVISMKNESCRVGFTQTFVNNMIFIIL